MRAAAVLAALALIAGCGGDDEALTVSAAASLRIALTEYGERFDARFSFAGSDELAAQIRQGGRPDVLVAANASLPRALHQEGLAEAPVAFATNELVVAVSTRSEVGAFADLARDGIRIAAGAESVPVGAYADDALRRLPATQGDRILANIRSREPDVGGIVGKVVQGAVDAGFVYRTDVQAAPNELRAIRLPAAARPDVTYAAVVVDGAGERARAFVQGLPGARALRDAGFGPAP